MCVLRKKRKRGEEKSVLRWSRATSGYQSAKSSGSSRGNVGRLTGSPVYLDWSQNLDRPRECKKTQKFVVAASKMDLPKVNAFVGF